MNLPVYSLENKKIIYFFLAIMLIGGIYSFFKLPKKEDSPFVIKQAVLVTQYPGATPQEVEKLITEPIEREIQSMSDVFQIKSESYFGMSKISIELQPTLAPDYMPVKWDELRRKVANIQPRLPSGASAINVSDDFGTYTKLVGPGHDLTRIDQQVLGLQDLLNRIRIDPQVRQLGNRDTHIHDLRLFRKQIDLLHTLNRSQLGLDLLRPIAHIVVGKTFVGCQGVIDTEHVPEIITHIDNGTYREGNSVHVGCFSDQV